MAGRPPGDEPPKVTIQVKVRPVVRDYLIKVAEVEHKSLSAVVNQILEWYHQGR